MKKSFISLLAIMIIAFCITACTDTKTPPKEEPSEVPDSSHPSIPHSHPHSTRHRFYSVEELYSFLHEPLWEIPSFEALRKKLLTEKTFLVPFYRDEEELFLEHIVFTEEGADGLPQFEYSAAFGFKDGYNAGCEIGHSPITLSFHITFFDEALIDEANEKGASWLKTQLNPTAWNLDNYENRNAKENRNVLVYEKFLQLGDREVSAVFIDFSLENRTDFTVLFVYDDIFVQMFVTPRILDRILPHITFYEVHLPTNTPTSDKPGRPWSKWSEG
jgi:hypothetical protein